MSTDTNTASYWLNWRFLLSALWVLTLILVSLKMILKFEGTKKSKTKQGHDTIGTLYRDEFWKTSWKMVCPVWLLVYRIVAFAVLLGYLVHILRSYGQGIFFFYTQWTFTLVTVYFGLALLFSIYGCWTSRYDKDQGANGTIGHVRLDIEHENDTPGTILGENDNMLNELKGTNSCEEPPREAYRELANIWGYIFQIIFQTSAGAAMLTDLVFWFILYPFLTHFDLSFMDVSMHTLNLAFLFGDLILNSLRFPFFRIAYMIWWTSIYVIYQWIVHVRAPEWWPYSFLDLSSLYAPLWYMAVGLLHIPCFGIFVLIIRYKHFCLSRLTSDIAQRLRLIGNSFSSLKTPRRPITQLDT